MANGKSDYLKYHDDRIKALIADDRWADAYRASLKASESTQQKPAGRSTHKTSGTKPGAQSRARDVGTL